MNHVAIANEAASTAPIFLDAPTEQDLLTESSVRECTLISQLPRVMVPRLELRSLGTPGNPVTMVSIGDSRFADMAKFRCE